MRDSIQSLIHCYSLKKSCKDCPYRYKPKECDKMFNKIDNILNKISEHLEFEDMIKYIKTITKKGDNDNESKD